MDIIVKIIQFFLCFTILIGIHEMGHFIMARVFKIRVEKFYIFFDPWFSLFKFKRKNTEYGLGWLPLGGYVKIAGMIDESMDKEYQKHTPQPWEFRSKPAWQRFLVMIAGVVMNVVLAVAVYIGICYTWGETYFSNADAKIGYSFNEAGHRLGFQDGDRFVTIDGEEVDNVNKIINSLLITECDRSVVVERNGQQVELILPLDELIAMRQQKGYENLLMPRIPFLIDSAVAPSVAQLRRGDEIVGIDNVSGLDFAGYAQYLKAHAGDSVLLKVLREGGMRFEFKAPVQEQGTIGVIRKGLTLRTQKYTLLEAIPAGIHQTGKMISSYWDQLKMIVQPRTKMYEELGGFISIGSIFPSTWNWQDFWMKTAFLSIILAVMNILPIPGLDGGHAIFTFWEMISGRKVSDKVLEAAQYVGLIIILFLLLYANGNDVYRFFIK
ncbi:RIP metalloprotease RseP [Alistipes sp.]|uniref:RIP metalloprotease RseP n=1 Tax=Alistipes sp. TaxID=1872444 RepID=UPI0025C5A0C3|nr:RIP metalloprotease RseP [Alistipes sp.]